MGVARVRLDRRDRERVVVAHAAHDKSGQDHAAETGPERERDDPGLHVVPDLDGRAEVADAEQKVHRRDGERVAAGVPEEAPEDGLPVAKAVRLGDVDRRGLVVADGLGDFLVLQRRGELRRDHPVVVHRDDRQDHRPVVVVVPALGDHEEHRREEGDREDVVDHDEPEDVAAPVHARPREGPLVGLGEEGRRALDGAGRVAELVDPRPVRMSDDR
mmetsp:Transcript_3919/g.11567  ORF Transcript_3919/g.11567 Transcript_3919/m.11567 type:complete len:216 (+) Transcript_3919:1-648(+)